jgi:hypothetical protein
MRHAWGPREERPVPWSVLPVGQYRCQRAGCGVIRTSALAPGYQDLRVTVYVTPDGTDHFGKAPACQGGYCGKSAKDESASGDPGHREP